MPKPIPSGIRKYSVAGPIAAAVCGLDGDEQGRPAQSWRPRQGHPRPMPPPIIQPGATIFLSLRQNFNPAPSEKILSSTAPSRPTSVWGDQWALGEALLEVSQARQPCWRLNFALPAA